MSGQLWTIVNAAGGVIEAAWRTPSTGSHPKDNGFAWVAGQMTAHRIVSAPDLAVQSWNGTAWAEDAAKVEAVLVAQVKWEAEQKRMAVLSAGGSKKMVYAKKQAEVDYFYSLGGTVAAILVAVGLLSSQVRSRRFRYALREQARRGEATIQAAIERFAAGNDASDNEVARIEAIEQAACSSIRAASTASAKRAAHAARSWSWGS